MGALRGGVTTAATVLEGLVGVPQPPAAAPAADLLLREGSRRRARRRPPVKEAMLKRRPKEVMRVMAPRNSRAGSAAPPEQPHVSLRAQRPPRGKSQGRRSPSFRSTTCDPRHVNGCTIALESPRPCSRRSKPLTVQEDLNARKRHPLGKPARGTSPAQAAGPPPRPARPSTAAARCLDPTGTATSHPCRAVQPLRS